MHPTREQRRTDILALVRRHPIRSQAELQKRLAAKGVDVNQATLSRDLRDLGLRKGPRGYEIPANGAAEDNDDPTLALRHAVFEWLVQATPVQNQVVVKTPPGGASPLGHALDHATLPDLVGTVAGDDTLLLICAGPRPANRLCKQLLDLQGKAR